MNEMILDILHDTLPMLPFLYITYIAMEYLEHRKHSAFQRYLGKAKRFGPLLGALLGIVPQCGFSVLACGLYMNRSISLGTLIAVFISTSDDAIPILIAQPSQLEVVVRVILVKLCIAVFMGYLIDVLIRTQYLKERHCLHDIHQDCEKEVAKHHSIAYIAFLHTMKIFAFIFMFNVTLTLFIFYVGEDTLSIWLASGSFVQPVLAALVGFIPNCAASVMLAQLAMDGVLSFGALCAGLITSAGLGLLVLFKMYDNKVDIIRILLILFITAVISGSMLQFLM